MFSQSMPWQCIVYFSENVDYNNDFCIGYNISLSLHNKQSEFAVPTTIMRKQVHLWFTKQNGEGCFFIQCCDSNDHVILLWSSSHMYLTLWFCVLLWYNKSEVLRETANIGIISTVNGLSRDISKPQMFMLFWLLLWSFKLSHLQ